MKEEIIIFIFLCKLRDVTIMFREQNRDCQTTASVCGMWKAVLSKESRKLVVWGKTLVDLKLKRAGEPSIRTEYTMWFSMFIIVLSFFSFQPPPSLSFLLNKPNLLWHSSLKHEYLCLHYVILNQNDSGIKLIRINSWFCLLTATWLQTNFWIVLYLRFFFYKMEISIYTIKLL